MNVFLCLNLFYKTKILKLMIIFKKGSIFNFFFPKFQPYFSTRVWGEGAEKNGIKIIQLINTEFLRDKTFFLKSKTKKNSVIFQNSAQNPSNFGIRETF